jgi:hypothetical protein
VQNIKRHTQPPHPAGSARSNKERVVLPFHSKFFLVNFLLCG